MSEPERPSGASGAPAAPPGWRPAGAAPASAARPEHTAILQAGQRQLMGYVQDGYAVYLVAGIAGVGKTELLVAYQKQRALEDDTVYLPPSASRAGGADPTVLGTLICYPIAAAGRKVVLVDASGEHFRGLYPHLRRSTAVTAADVDFLKLVGKSLHGLVLLVDLNRLWNPTQEADQEQVEIANWILILLRWLLFAGTYDENSGRAFHEEVNRAAMLLERRLPQPVLVLFSRADQLNGLALPGEPQAASPPAAPKRTLFPLGEQALLLAYHALPRLYRSVRTHGDHFHFDFAHSLLLDASGKMIAQREPCGVTSSLNWLLDPGWRWPGAIPSRHWIWLQQRLDRLQGRASRWRRLPPPEAAP
jgi:hypothetical protein